MLVSLTRCLASAAAVADQSCLGLAGDVSYTPLTT